MNLKENKIKSWSVSRYYKDGWITDDMGRPNKNDIKHILKVMGFDSIREFNNASKHYGYSINKQLQEKLISIFDMSKPSSFDEIMIYKSWYGLENDIKFPFKLSPNVSEQSIFIRDCCIEKINNKETSNSDNYSFNIRASVSHRSFFQPRKDSFDEICSLLVRRDSYEIDQFSKDDLEIISSYINEEIGNLKLVENEDFLKTKKFTIDQEEVFFVVLGEDESIEISGDF